VLAHIDDPQDVEAIGRFSSSKSQYLFRSAVLSLAMMCNDAANSKLIALEKDNRLSGQRDYISETRKKFSAMKAKGYMCR
jgi:hypothetical protein